jgi:serine protease Do
VQSPSVSASLQNVEAGVKNVARSVSPSVASIVISKDVPVYRTDPFGFFYQPSGTVRQEVGGGTAFFIRKDGYLLTNKHVVSDPSASYSVILSNGKELSGKVLAFDPTTDLAVVRAYVSDNTPYTDAKPVTFLANSSDLSVGSFVIAIGNALAEFRNTLTFGVVSAMGRSIQAGDQASGTSEGLSGLIQTDAAINPGNSGGPLVDLAGHVVGINTAVTQGANGIGFAIPLSEKIVNNIVNSVVKNGAIKRAYLGIRYAPLDAKTASALGISADVGVLVSGGTDGPGVVPGSPSDQAGIKSGDVITEADGKPLSASYGLAEALAEKAPGDTVQFKYFRKGSGYGTVQVKLGERPAGG